MHDTEGSHYHAGGTIIYERTLTSVGIDIGSATTHLTFSDLVIGQTDSHFQRKPEVLRRDVRYRSPIMFTPYRADGTIDQDGIETFVQRCYRDAGLTVDEVQSGAVICTGEAARRDNARRITERLAEDTGKFVCATAGHHFEGILAANGSGTVDQSRNLAGPVINLDIGGGTAKRTVSRAGTIEDTSAINIGARLVAFDESDMIVRAEPAARRIGQSIGLDIQVGARVTAEERGRLADVMADVLMEFLGLREMSALARELLVTEPPAERFDKFWLVCSGGVSEYIYAAADSGPSDLGPLLGTAVRRKLGEVLPEGNLLAPAEAIRATVIGACQFTLQVSGETVFASRNTVLPLNNLPVLAVPIDWNRVVAAEISDAVVRTLASMEEETPCALFLGGPEQFGYGKLTELARGIAAGFAATGCTAHTVLIFSNDIAHTVGRSLRTFLPKTPFLCLDEVQVANLDYVDIAPPPAGEAYYPVVVKSLVFTSRQHR